MHTWTMTIWASIVQFLDQRLHLCRRVEQSLTVSFSNFLQFISMSEYLFCCYYTVVDNIFHETNPSDHQPPPPPHKKLIFSSGIIFVSQKDILNAGCLDEKLFK